MRLPRPYIPLGIRVQVAERQLRERYPARAPSIFYGLDEPMPLATRLRRLLAAIFGSDAKLELHHRPALINRRRKGNNYDPPANSPDYLVYLPKDEHDVETRVRGVGAQLSDLAIAARTTRTGSRPPCGRSPRRSRKRSLNGKLAHALDEICGGCRGYCAAEDDSTKRVQLILVEPTPSRRHKIMEGKNKHSNGEQRKNKPYDN